MDSRLLGAFSACAIAVATLPAYAVGISGQGTWETTLQARDFDGDLNTIEGYYDTVQGITWMAEANATGLLPDWDTAIAWAAGLNLNGITGWRLPYTVDVGNDGLTYTNYYQGVDAGYNITTHSEMSHMFYETLGNFAYYDTAGNPNQPGWRPMNTGPFSNLQTLGYWSATEYAPNPTGAFGQAWYFAFDTGLQSAPVKYFDFLAWAVHDGDVGAVIPVPAAVWLSGSGLLALIGIARKKAA